MSNLHLQLVTPERTVLSETLDSLTCPTTMGEITILPGHAALLAELIPGELIARVGNTSHNIHVAGGFVQIKPNSEVSILADTAEHALEIDTERAEEAAKKAKETLNKVTPQDELYAAASASLERNLSRLRVAKKHAHRRTSPITGEGVLKK